MLDKVSVMKSVAYCGLICGLYQPESVCSCRSNNHYGKRLPPEGCYQYTCCREKGVVYHRNGIWGDYDLVTEDAVLKPLRE